MDIIGLPEIRRVLNYEDIIGRMRDALIAHSRGECDTPLPMHLDIAPDRARVHMNLDFRFRDLVDSLLIASMSLFMRLQYDEDALKVNTQWVRNKVRRFSSLSTARLGKTGVRLAKHARYDPLLQAESHLTRDGLEV